MTWITLAPATLSAFLASLVEVVEAFTIVLAVWTLQGARPALAGTAAALALLGLVVAVFGPILAFVPLHLMQLVIGTLLLLFGLGWLRKASLRLAGIVPLHDEAAIFARETAELAREGVSPAASAWLGGMVAFKAVLLEGLEVAFIVIATGVGGHMAQAATGAALACALVLAAGVIIHRPLTRVPENALKFAVGVMLSAFGVFWTGEGLGIEWPGGDLALIPFAALFLGAGLLAAFLARRQREARA
jgi:uncharacterized membrane protein